VPGVGAAGQRLVAWTGLGCLQDSVRALANAKGWRIDPGWVIEENDVSASTKRIRPGFERLLDGMRSG
jgi:DNA invertase Pin-like site-specific DNA recombinase